MDDASEKIVNKFLSELSEELTKEDITNLKKTLKGFSGVLESKDDLKKLIEYWKSQEKISDEKIAQMQQAAEDTRAFRALTRQYQNELAADLKVLKASSIRLAELQEQHWDPTLKSQKALLEMGEKINGGIFAQALSSSIIEGFGKNQSFRKLFGDTSGIQSISKGVSGLIKGIGGVKEIFSLMKKGSPAREAADAKKRKNELQKEYERLKLQLTEGKDELKYREGAYEANDPRIQQQRDRIKDLEERLKKNTQEFGSVIATESAAIERQRLGDKGFEELHGLKLGSSEFKNWFNRISERYTKNLRIAADIPTSDGKTGNASNELKENSIKEGTQLQKMAERSDDNSKKTEKVNPPGNGVHTVEEVVQVQSKNSDTSADKPKKIDIYIGDESVKLEKTKTPTTYPQLMGSLALWVEEELKDKDDESSASKHGAGARGSGGLAIVGGAGFLTKAWEAIKKFGGWIATGLVSFWHKVGPILARLGPTLGRIGLTCARLLNPLTWILTAIEGFMTGFKLGNAILDWWESDNKAKENVSVAARNEKRTVEYQKADDKKKIAMFEAEQNKYNEDEKKLKKMEEDRIKLESELRAATVQSDRDKIADKLGKLKDTEEELKKYHEQDRIFLQVREENYKKMKSKSEIESQTKPEVEMQKNAVRADNRTANEVSKLNANVERLAASLPEAIGVGTAVGINNA